MLKKKMSEDDLKPSHLLEEGIPANKKEFNNAQASCVMTHEDTTQVVQKFFKEKGPIEI